ncbi:hypothetical protein CCYA_CCYA17G4391 [Cyanidiococcus yangmingshanensis]|nr:hypothetical protein CCYA_CCYA17G4391 [Cyanidiococcus yangmingshanensis]
MLDVAFLWNGVYEKALAKPIVRRERRNDCKPYWSTNRYRRRPQVFRVQLVDNSDQEQIPPVHSPFSGIATSESVHNKSKYAEVLLEKNEALRRWTEENLERPRTEKARDDTASDTGSVDDSLSERRRNANDPEDVGVSGKRSRRFSRPPRPWGFWTEENLVREVLEFVERRPKTKDGPEYMPTSNELRRANRSDLVQAIIRFGGYVKIAERCGLRTHRRESYFWRKDFGRLEKEIWDFIRERDGPEALPPEAFGKIGDDPAPSGKENSERTTREPQSRPRMPTYNELAAAKKYIVCYAINSYGGFHEVAKRMNLEISSDETPWRSRDALIAELKRLFGDLMEKQNRLPRQQDLVRLGRHDLDWAIHRWHGGYVRLAASMGYLRSRLPCKPRNFWSEEKNLENELRALLKATNLGWRMPRRDELEALDRHDLIYAIRKFGGFITVASKLGLSRESINGTRPRGYWSNFENLRNELEAFIQENGHPGIMPRFDQFRMYDREDLIRAIQRHGGPAEVARRMHYFWYGPSSFWRDFENVRKRLCAFLQKPGQPQGRMPTQQELILAGRLDLVYGVHLHGGVYEVAWRLGLDVVDPPRAPFYWNAFENVETEIFSFLNCAVTAAWIQNGVMPTSITVVRSGRRDLAASIRRHGGWDVITRRFNLRPACPKRSKGYWNSFRNVEAELLLYVEQREQVVAEFLRNHAAWLLSPADENEHAAGQAPDEDAGVPAPDRASRPFRSIVDAIRNGERVPAMPTADELRLDGRADLLFACERIHGGLAAVASRIGWRSLSERLSLETLKNDRDALERELMTMWMPLYGAVDEMPREEDLLRTGRVDIHEAILHHGGYVAMARSMNLRHPEDPEWKDWYEKRFVKQRKSTKTTGTKTQITEKSESAE